MKSSKGIFLLQTPAGWQITTTDTEVATFHDLECDHDVAPEALAQRVEAFLDERELAKGHVLIGVNSASTLVASLTIDPQDQRKRTTLKYELEGVLPYAAEQIVADYIAADNRVFAACVQIETWLPIVIELEVRGLRLQSIAPVALLGLQSYLNRVASQGTTWILWHDGDSSDLFQCLDKTVGKWCHWRQDPAAATRQLIVETLHQSKPLRCELVNATAGPPELPGGMEFHQVATTQLVEHAFQSAKSILEGNSSPLIELRREELAAGDPHRAVRGPLRLLYVAAAIFFVVLTSVLWGKSVQYQRWADDLWQQQVSTFREAFPDHDSPVPAGIQSRLRSEHAKLSAARSGTSDVELPVSALHVLFEFLSALPDGQRYRIQELRIEDGRLDIDAELRSHQAASVLVSSFEKRGFSVSPPTTLQEGPQTVASRIFADIRVADEQQGDW